MLMRMAHSGILPARLELTNPRHKTPAAAILLSATFMLLGTAAMSVAGFTGSEMYDLAGSLAVFGFLTVYALVSLALPFARNAVGQHSWAVAAVSVFTALVMLMVAVFDIRSATDPVHARIPYIFIAYIAAGLGWYGLRRRRATESA